MTEKMLHVPYYQTLKHGPSSVVSLEVSSSVVDPSHVKKDHDYVHFHW